MALNNTLGPGDADMKHIVISAGFKSYLTSTEISNGCYSTTCINTNYYDKATTYGLPMHIWQRLKYNYIIVIKQQLML